MSKTIEVQVEEIVEEFSEKYYKDYPEGFRVDSRESHTAMIDWLTQTLQAERKRCEEMVGAERERIVELVQSNKDAYMMPQTEQRFIRDVEALTNKD